MKKNFLYATLAIVSVGILTSVSSIWFSSRQTNDSLLLSSIDTSDWLVYENKEYGYRFKYPRDAKIVDDKEFPYNMNSPKSITISLPEKHAELKNPEVYDEDIITIQLVTELMSGYVEELYKGWDGYVPQIYKRSDNSDGIVYDGGIYLVKESEIYSFGLLRRNPKHMPWLTRDQFEVLKENYSNETNILHGIYSTFEIMK